MVGTESKPDRDGVREVFFWSGFKAKLIYLSLHACSIGPCNVNEIEIIKNYFYNVRTWYAKFKVICCIFSPNIGCKKKYISQCFSCIFMREKTLYNSHTFKRNDIKQYIIDDSACSFMNAVLKSVLTQEVTNYNQPIIMSTNTNEQITKLIVISCFNITCPNLSHITRQL
jgi:hypothetical protein